MFESCLAVAAAAGFSGILLMLTKRWHEGFSLDGITGVQKHHSKPTPRIGGVAIAIGMVVAWMAADDATRRVLGPMLMAGIPAFAFGLAEDITKQVGVAARLTATMFSGALAWDLTGVAMQNTGFPPLDVLLQFTPVAILFTAFAVGGVANAINIIDGFNGLAAGATAIMLVAIGLIAQDVGDTALANVSFLAAACAIGFGAVNWPFGKIFLGDGGAYGLGFMLAWAAVLLPMRNPQVTAWATIMVCAYPVLEVGFSVARRRKRNHHAGQPDKAHLHHFIHRRFVRRHFPNLERTLQNGWTSPPCWLLTAIPAGWAVAFAQQPTVLAIGFGLAAIGYGGIYARLTQFRWCIKAHTLRLHVAKLQNDPASGK